MILLIIRLISALFLAHTQPNFLPIDATILIRLGKLLRLMESTQLSPAIIGRVAVSSPTVNLPELDQDTLTALAAVQDLIITCGFSVAECADLGRL